MSDSSQAKNIFHPVTHALPVFVVRQAVYDRDQNVWGYALRLRNQGDPIDPKEEAARLIVDGFTIASTGLPDDRKFLIRFPQEQLTSMQALALPREAVVAEIHSTAKPTAETIKATAMLRKAGYAVAVHLPFHEHFIKLANYLKIDITGRSAPDMFKLTNKLAGLGKTLIADGIETRELYDLGMSMGYELFHGPVFQKPTVLKANVLSATAASKLQLIHQLSREDYEVKDVARIIASDLSLSYRLLRFINSASFSLREKVRSLDHAISIIGRNPLKQWLMAVTLMDNSTDPSAMETCFLSMQRGRFLELLAEAMPNPPFHKDLMLLLGLFSLLDVLLSATMEEIVTPLPLDQTVKQALIGKEGEGGQFLTLAENVEKGDWQSVNSVLNTYGLGTKDAAIKYNMASLWAQEILNSCNMECAEEGGESA